jgi:hypothetical protein
VAEQRPGYVGSEKVSRDVAAQLSEARERQQQQQQIESLRATVAQQALRLDKLERLLAAP